MRSTKAFMTAFLFLALLLFSVEGFVPSVSQARAGYVVSTPTVLASSRRTEQEKPSYLLDEFRTYRGDLIDPYKILKVSRTAERSEIKTSYRNLSRRYHPDSARHRDILPGSCNNEDDVRDHWEKIKLSYEILSDTKRRKRYDRHEALADPGKAVRRAAASAAVNGMTSVGKGIGHGIVKFGSFAFNHFSKNADNATTKNAVEEAA